ncbi:MAG: N-acetylmuramoyl-L-alanine amidase [Lachnospiraceae bacterium]|nr:N-acetylmuramoyl-L-alanine amidase [Lachnospiraceae bacterium]
MRKTAIFSSLFTIIALIVAFFALENSVLLAESRFSELADDFYEIDIPDENAVDIIVPEVIETEQEAPLSSDSLTFELGNADTNFLIIPVPDGTRLNDVAIENHYLTEEMWINIGSVAPDFYAANPISGNRKNILGGTYEITEDKAVLKFSLDNIYEYRSIIENNNIYVEFVPPREMHSRIIVIDPAYGGSMAGIVANDLAEKDVALSIALRLKELLDQTDYLVYYTRTLDNDLSEEKRVRIANNTRADMLIRIEADSNENSLINGTTTIYSGFFIPHFGSPELANILETEVVLSIRGKALGIYQAEAADYVITNATVPAASIKVGHLTNAQEANLLKRDDYLEKIAIGIFNAILAAYEEKG